MHAAGLRRAGFAATVVAALLMLGAAVHGMTRVDTTLQLAAAPPPAHQVYVVDERRHQDRFGRACDGPRVHRPRI
jgi:hypothetical protein